MEIKLRAAFTGMTWLPSWIALTTSNMSPHLILEDDTINYKVMRAIRRPYADIASVDFRKSWGTRNIILRFHNSSTTFTGNAVSDEEAKHGLAALREKGCALSIRAEAFANQV